MARFAVGSQVTGWRPGDRVAVPFICACGSCPQCRAGQQQVCPRQLQPGFSYWGSFAEYVAIPYAEVNLVRLPESIDFPVAATLGCRFATSYRAVTSVAAVRPGEWLAVFGCGGVGLSAVMIAAAAGARVIASYPSPAGVTECELDLAAWDKLAAAHPLLRALAPDVEAILVIGGGPHEAGRIETFLVPIDVCYSLAGALRLDWHGFDGGAEVRRILTDLLGRLRQRAKPLDKTEA